MVKNNNKSEAFLKHPKNLAKHKKLFIILGAVFVICAAAVGGVLFWLSESEQYKIAVGNFSNQLDVLNSKRRFLKEKVVEARAVNLIDNRFDENEIKKLLEEILSRAAELDEEDIAQPEKTKEIIEETEKLANKADETEGIISEINQLLERLLAEAMTTFRAELEEKIAESEKLFSDSKGNVASEAVRSDLQAKIDAAKQALQDENNYEIFYQRTEELKQAIASVNDSIARKQAQLLAAKRHAEEMRRRAEWTSIPAGQRIVNEASSYLMDVYSAYHASEWNGWAVPANGNYATNWRKYVGTGQLDDCGRFVATAVRASGIDWSFPTGSKLWTGTIASHMRSSSTWQSVPNTGNLADLQPGDVFVEHNGTSAGSHTFIYLGNGQGAHARWGWAMPYAFDIMKPYERPELWPTDPGWDGLNNPRPTYEELVSSDGQFYNGVWGNKYGSFEIFRANY